MIASSRKIPYMSCVVLAAGRSSRMLATHGTHKLLAELDGKTVLAHTIETLRSLPFHEIIVVTGFQRDDVEQIADECKQTHLRSVFNSEYASGMASSIRAGVNALSGDADGVMIALGDMPFVQRTTYIQLLNLFTEHSSFIHIPTRSGKRGNPVLFPIAYKQELISLSGDMGAKPVLIRHADMVQEIEMDDEGILSDLDTSEDLTQAASFYRISLKSTSKMPYSRQSL
jgi:molybdenum cofactor cytidylyltransferase